MNNIRIWLLIIAFFGWISSASSQSHIDDPEQSGGVNVQDILSTQESWDGSHLPVLPGVTPEVTVTRMTISPGTLLPTHLHTGLYIAYIETGELTVTRTSDPNGDFSNSDDVVSKVVHAGDALIEVPNTWHYGENTGSTDVNLVLVFVGESGIAKTLIAPE